MGKAETREKVERLFKYIAELNKLRAKNVTDFQQANGYEWKLFLSDIHPVSPWVSIPAKSVEGESSKILLSVRNPELPKCPATDSTFKDWLRRGYDDAFFQNDFVVKSRPKSNGSDASELENFEDDAERVAAYNKWLVKRKAWAEQYRNLKEIQDLFILLYSKYVQLEQMSDSVELVVANGFVYDAAYPEFNHPILSKKVKILFLQNENKIQIVDGDDGSELNESFIRSMHDVYLQHFQELKKELESEDYHPLDGTRLDNFLKRFVANLNPDNCFVQNFQDLSTYRNRLRLYMNPVFYIRKKDDGVLNAVNAIIEDLKNGGEIPPYLEEIVCGGMAENVEAQEDESLEAALASVGGEDVDILLSKEANSEQLQIARRIEMFNAVSVQGPPGTGKTHTIANLLGHFLAQGKKVLVTSHTKKALTVLKEKVVPNLQCLCVSVMDDSKEDMERSVNGITEFMSQNDSIKLQRDMNRLGVERRQVIDDLANVRKRIFGLIQKECSSIDVCGESFSPSQASSFVVDNMERLSYIPGKVALDAPLPLTFEELRELYMTNKEISIQDEREFSYELPSLNEIPRPEEYCDLLQTIKRESEKISALENSLQCKVERSSGARSVTINSCEKFSAITLANFDAENLKSVKDVCSYLKAMKQWQVAAAVDGKNGGALKDRWILLVRQIKLVDEKCELLVKASFGKPIEIRNRDVDLKRIVDKMLPVFREKGKISKLTRFFNKDFEQVFKGVCIDGRPFETAEDCELLSLYLDYHLELNKCSVYWHNLIAQFGDEEELLNLGSEYPIKIARNMVPTIEAFLKWNECCLLPLIESMDRAGLLLSAFLDVSAYFNKEYVNKVLDASRSICSVVDILLASEKLASAEIKLKNIKATLKLNSRIYSDVCKNLIRAVDASNSEMYVRAYEDLGYVLNKHDILQKRKTLLSKLAGGAPDWADFVRRRQGIHGGSSVPETIMDAWRWKQCSQIVAKIIAEPFDALQQRSMEMSRRYREITAEYAEKCAWFHLLQEFRRNISLNQALTGWARIARRIGKGTGRNAPRYRAEARALMTQCQNAVPVWIMPMSKVFESFVPGKNLFDIVIIDEASQADVSALAMTYMAKKAIIVGDDQQVSPMAIGVDLEKSNALLDTYLKGEIPNYNLYDMKGSVYDIASTTFHPLMLREHFRCVPEIIGFSNALSYDCKIKPMRDGGDNKLLPAVVNFRVEDGKRQGKHNKIEAKNVVALLKACLMQEEYADKTFGVISLLGTEQVKTLTSCLYRYVDPRDLEKHRVLCGDAASFQGDERDVIFLSLVDSSDGEGPLRMVSDGADDAIKKRYNVATSRAKNQMWVVHSLNSAIDLKPDDMRKRLIDYASNPVATAVRNEIEVRSESPFEEMVAKALVSLGYSVSMQYQVGAYRLDMVVHYGKKNVAVECDGERYHSGDAKIREDMERQAILERIGWRFIRIRGCEYFRDSAKTMERVVGELKKFGVYPEKERSRAASFEPSLLDRVRACAALFLSEMSD